jgi:hypothetical protein
MSSHVLLLTDQGTGGLAAVRGLRAGGYEPWVGVSDGGSYAARSRAAAGVVRLPDPEHGERYAERVAGFAHEAGVVAVLPGTTRSLVALSGRERLFDGIALGSCGKAALERVTGTEAVAKLAGEVGAPAIPPGPDVRAGLCAVSGIACRGGVRSALHQNAPRVWATRTGTAAFCQTLAPSADREELVGAILEALDWTGIYHVPLLETSHGITVADFTPHVWGSFALAQFAGHNLAAAWVDLLLGREPELGAYRVGVGLRIEERDYPALLAEALGGAPGRALSKLRPRRDVHHAVLSIADPAPALVLGANLARAAARVARRRRTGSS